MHDVGSAGVRRGMGPRWSAQCAVAERIDGFGGTARQSTNWHRNPGEHTPPTRNAGGERSLCFAEYFRTKLQQYSLGRIAFPTEQGVGVATSRHRSVEALNRWQELAPERHADGSPSSRLRSGSSGRYNPPRTRCRFTPPRSPARIPGFPMVHRRSRLLPLLLAAPLLANAFAGPLRAADDAPGVRLLVLVVFDQMRGDYLTRWEKHFGEGGFRRLMREGAVFDACHYPFAATFTATGHASLATGCSPDRHGIVGNEWVDRKSIVLTASVASTRYDRVPSAGNAAQTSAGSRVSPELLTAETLPDVLKQSSSGQSRIVSLSLKDRSAILLAGKGATACYWFDEESGMFVTSQFYSRQLHPWVESFNRERHTDSWFDRPWQPLRPELDYDSLIGPDRARGEAAGVRQGVAFPHPTNGGLPQPGPAYYAALTTSPYGNELLLELALRAIESEKLGTRETADMLCLSFSSNDAIGHSWGPDSQEVFDATLRSDVVVEKLLESLDDRVGKGRYLLVLTSDHGICPLPEVSIAKGKSAGRVSISALQRAANAFL
ncbi:MAG: hypothetical protein EHM42_06415, partial [Planctomycetaceae bacterium]